MATIKKNSAPALTTPTQPKPGDINICVAGVRFDRERSQWGILDSNLKTIRSFERGVILNATMESKKVRTGIGCGSSTDVIGAAYGEIHENTYGGGKIPQTGFKNLEFKDGVFVNGEGERITEASVIRLMPGRKAVYRP